MWRTDIEVRTRWRDLKAVGSACVYFTVEL